MNFTLAPVARAVTHCESCGRAVVLECEGTVGPAGYETYNEFACPHCRKTNRTKTSGRILSVMAVGEPVR